MFDLMKTRASKVIELDLAAGVSVSTEGIWMVSKLEGGSEKAALPTPAPTDRLLGYVVTDAEDHESEPNIENLMIPAALVFTTRLMFLPKAGSLRVHDKTSNVDLTPVVGVPAAGQYSVTDFTLTFNAAQAGHAITVFYRYEMTVGQARQHFYQRHISRAAGGVFGRVALGCGNGEIFTSAFDTSKVYDVFAPGEGLIVDANGMITVGVLATGLALPGFVIQLPSADAKFLGIRFNF